MNGFMSIVVGLSACCVGSNPSVPRVRDSQPAVPAFALPATPAAVNVGYATVSLVASGFYFTDTTGVDLNGQFAFGVALSRTTGWDDNCPENSYISWDTPSLLSDSCDTDGCSVSVTPAYDPLFELYEIKNLVCNNMSMSIAAIANGVDLPITSARSYVQSFAGYGTNYSFKECGGADPVLRGQDDRLAAGLGHLVQIFTIDEQTADFELGYAMCVVTITGEWGPVGLRPWRNNLGGPQIGDYLSFPRTLVSGEFDGMDPSNVIVGVVRSWYLDGMIPNGTIPFSAPDGAGSLDGMSFSKSTENGEGKDDYFDVWSGSATGSISDTNYVGPGVTASFRIDGVDGAFGDTNLDGRVSAADVTALSLYLGMTVNPPYLARMDIDRDGSLTSDDLDMLDLWMDIDGFPSILLGDVDGDGDVDNDDLTAIASQIGKGWGDAGFAPQADIDQDGEVTTNDEDLLDA